MDEQEGESHQPVAGQAAAERSDLEIDPARLAQRGSRRAVLAGVVVVASLIAAGAFLALGPVRFGGSGPQACPPAATPGPAGLSRDCAIELATDRSTGGAFISARSGRYGDLLIDNGPLGVDRNRLVWAVEFVAPPFCLWPPPVGPSAPATCIPYGAGMLTVVLDYATGDFISSGAEY